MDLDTSDGEPAMSSQQSKAATKASETSSAAGDSTAGKVPAKPKKKGTATTVKGPKRPAKTGSAAGTGGTRTKPGGGGGKKKLPASTVGSEGGPVPDLEDDDEQDGGDREEGSESDSGPYCICRGPDNHRFMIACDKCEDWFHGDCIGMDKYTGENLVQRYICPSCSDESMGYVTRYKKTCALEDCERPARIYDAAVADGSASVFCGNEHCQAWWEQLIAELPRAKRGHKASLDDALTQEQFMGLLGVPPKAENGWTLGEKPFGVPSDFWDHADPKDVFTEEEGAFLSASAADRYNLGEEIVLCKKMLQLIDMAAKRREGAVGAGKGSAKDLCGYDFRLDTVSVPQAFSRFLQSPAGEAVFKTGRLEAPPPPPSPPGLNSYPPGFGCDAAELDPDTAGMCARKKCKPHGGWNAMLTKHVKHQMKELAREAKEKLDVEERVRESAASRYVRRKYENNTVRMIGSDGEEEPAGDVQMEDAV